MYQIKVILNQKIRAKEVKILRGFPMHYLDFFCFVFSFLLWYNIHTEECVKCTSFDVQSH